MKAVSTAIRESRPFGRYSTSVRALISILMFHRFDRMGFHKNIVQAYGMDDVGSRRQIVMERADGDLFSLLVDGKLNLVGRIA